MAKVIIAKLQEKVIRAEVKAGTAVGVALKRHRVVVTDRGGREYRIDQLSAKQFKEIDLRVNDKAATLSTKLKNGDIITLVPEISGGAL